METVCRLCRANGSLLTVDEVQTGFCRTGPMFAMSEDPATRVEAGDHGGTENLTGKEQMPSILLMDPIVGT